MAKQQNKLKKMSFQRSDCPVACVLDVLGDKWTMLVVRDLFRGKHRFTEFMQAKEGIKTNILTDRLKRLEQAGLIDKAPYQDNPPRYEYKLTGTGKDLWPILKEMILWSNRNIPATSKPLSENN
jgi:DNA-binding HxlR family transcriptional regulator